MKKVFPLILFLPVLLGTFALNATPQSGRKNVRPAADPAPPVQAPIFSPPPPDLRPAPTERATLNVVPESLLQRPLKSLDKSSFRLADFGGKVVVLNFWASWCGPCRSEAPDYEKVRKEYAGLEVEFIGLTTEDPRTASDRVKQFARSYNFGFRLGWADRETAYELMDGRGGIPQTLVLSPGGRIVNHWTGYTRGQSGDRLRATIERALSGASLPGKKSGQYSVVGWGQRGKG